MATNGVGIIGTGISGLTLALRLQQLGIEATLYSESGIEELSQGKLPNTVACSQHGIAREQALGIDNFSSGDHQMTYVHVSVKGDPSLEFRGDTYPIRAVDFRLLLPSLLGEFISRGGRLAITGTPPAVEHIQRWSLDHELMVVAAGRQSVAELFPRDPSRSPYDRPQRSLLAGLFTGLALPEPRGLSFNISPGCGEIFQMAMWTRAGLMGSLLIEAIPGGPWEAVSRLDYRESPRVFIETLMRLLGEYAPRIAERVDPGAFGLIGPDDLLQGALTPVVRQPVARLSSGRIAVAVGDAWITNDPITGQGANLGSHCAWALADRIAKGGPFDVEFGRRAAEEMWRFAGAVTAWTNAFLQPPADHVLRLLAAAAAEKAVADLFIDMFNNPVGAWAVVSNPSRVDALISH